jgi:hypothetical protein
MLFDPLLFWHLKAFGRVLLVWDVPSFRARKR